MFHKKKINILLTRKNKYMYEYHIMYAFSTDIAFVSIRYEFSLPRRGIKYPIIFNY